MVKIDYYYKNIHLGTFDLKDGSTQAERDALAQESSIYKYDKFILDGGRVIGYMKDGKLDTVKSRDSRMTLEEDGIYKTFKLGKNK